MKAIAHRGNVNGKSWLENNPKYLIEAISKGFDVELDIRYIDKNWYLGHDAPTYKVNLKFLESISKNSWMHCKNLDALKELDPTVYNFFWHQEDDFTLTSKGFIWTYPQKPITNKSVIVDVDLQSKNFFNAYGVCTDYVNLLDIL